MKSRSKKKAKVSLHTPQTFSMMMHQLMSVRANALDYITGAAFYTDAQCAKPENVDRRHSTNPLHEACQFIAQWQWHTLSSRAAELRRGRHTQLASIQCAGEKPAS